MEKIKILGISYCHNQAVFEVCSHLVILVHHNRLFVATITEDVPSVLEYCETRMNQLLSGVTSMVVVGEEINKHQVLRFLILVFVKKYMMNVRVIEIKSRYSLNYYYVRCCT